MSLILPPVAALSEAQPGIPASNYVDKEQVPWSQQCDRMPKPAPPSGVEEAGSEGCGNVQNFTYLGTERKTKMHIDIGNAHTVGPS